MSPRDLVMAARVADALVYVVGLAGVVAGALRYRATDLGAALVAWILTFVAGAVLRLVAFGARALAEVLERSRRLEDAVADLRVERVAAERRQGEGDGSWGWHQR